MTNPEGASTLEAVRRWLARTVDLSLFSLLGGMALAYFPSPPCRPADRAHRHGMALGIPLIALITQGVSYQRLRQSGSTRWDELWATKVAYDPLPAPRLAALVAATLGLFGLVFFYSGAYANFAHMQLRAQRAEVAINAAAIAKAQDEYYKAHGRFLGLPVQPRPEHDLDGVALAWPEVDPWSQLGWRPKGAVRGAYRVEVPPDGASFVVVGVCDVDNDDEVAMFQWDSTVGKAARLTPNDVF